MSTYGSNERNLVRQKKLKRKRRKRLMKRMMVAALGLVLAVGALQCVKALGLFRNGENRGSGFVEEKMNKLQASVISKRIDSSDVNADTLKNLLKNNPETKNFVKNYKEKKEQPPAESIGTIVPGEIPLLLQWDERWGYGIYGDQMIAVNGCGPTSVAMVAAGLTGDTSLTPYKVAKLAEEQGYYEGDAGTSWLFMTEGVQQFGIYGEEMALTEQGILSALEAGQPIICSMRPGDFTKTGHFIVLTGVENGKIKVNDPNSVIRSEKLWDYDRLEPQINNLWTYTI